MIELMVAVLMEPVEQETRSRERATDPRFPREDCDPCAWWERHSGRTLDRLVRVALGGLCPRCRRCRGHVSSDDGFCDDCGEAN